MATASVRPEKACHGIELAASRPCVSAPLVMLWTTVTSPAKHVSRMWTAVLLKLPWIQASAVSMTSAMSGSLALAMAR
jgi:Kef-type K+ transport system membrane component KefB